MRPTREIRTLAHEESEFMHRQRVREHFDSPIAGVGISASDAVGGTRTITLQVKDRLRDAWAGRWLVRVWISPTDGGDPDGTNNTVSLVSGFTTQIIAADAEFEGITGEDGKFVFDLTVIGTDQRFITAVVIGKGETAKFIW